MSIIIVDENLTNQMIIMSILENAGYTDVSTVLSARELFIFLKMDTPENKEEPQVDLILLDIMTPEIDGIQICKRIQKHLHLRDIPIVFITNTSDSNKLADALDAGAVDYVIKPINKVELLARIRSALRLKFEKDRHKERDLRINTELELAKQVQASALSRPIDDENIEINAIYQPSATLAGDFYAWHRISENRYGVIILDMMGHGISSSLVCMFISSILQDTIKNISEPQEVISELNRYMNILHWNGKLANYYFTAIYLVIDTKEKTINYVNAGHPPGILLVDGKVEYLNTSCCAVGFFENLEITKRTLHYQHSLRIMLYTDGLVEFIDYNHLAFSELETIYNKPELAANQEDDICLLRISVKGSSNGI
jgi:sigma-B regulation protein RsbU (phosphoserine phosphatase)